MNSFIYYFPGRKTKGDQKSFDKLLSDCELTELTDGCSFPFVEANDGPEGAGLFVGVCPKGQMLSGIGYYPKKQTWFQWKNYWIGFKTDNPPAPEDLEREKMVEGLKVPLSDGKKWIVPAARYLEEGTCFEHNLIMMPSGELVKEILAKYKPFWLRAGEMLEAWRKDELEEHEEKIMSDLNIWDFSAQALGLNYRINHAGISAMKLFSDKNHVHVAGAAIGLKLYEDITDRLKEAEAKKASAVMQDGEITHDGVTA